jgi:hypothetical protein
MVDYINLPLDIQLSVARALESTDARATVRLALTSIFTYAHTLAVSTTNDTRLYTAANFKGTYISTLDFNRFCKKIQDEGTLPQHRFSVFICPRSDCGCNFYRCNGEHFTPHLVPRYHRKEYHNIVLKESESELVNLPYYDKYYIKHSVASYTHSVPPNCEELMAINIECVSGDEDRKLMLTVACDWSVMGVQYNPQVVIKYTVVV